MKGGWEKRSQRLSYVKLVRSRSFVKGGSGTIRVMQRALALSSLSHTFFLFVTNLYKLLPQLPVVIAKSHVNASGLNFDILFPNGSGDIGHVRKSANRAGVCKELSRPKLKTKHVWEREGSASASCMTGLGLGNGTMQKAI